MSNHSQTDYAINWYELWTKQTALFFESSEQYLGNIFHENKKPNPQEHIQQIDAWVEMLGEQWANMAKKSTDKMQQDYWKMMIGLCNEATDLMLLQWIKRYQEGNPVTNIRELYEIWLEACHEIYQKSLRSKAYQDAYGSFMQATLKFWQTPVK